MDCQTLGGCDHEINKSKGRISEIPRSAHETIARPFDHVRKVTDRFMPLRVHAIVSNRQAFKKMAFLIAPFDYPTSLGGRRIGMNELRRPD
jgi:hypothetical protein